MHKLSNTPLPCWSGTTRGLAALVLAASVAAAWGAPTTPFTFVESGIYGPQGEQLGRVAFDQSQTHGVDVMIGTAPGAYARTRSEFGSNGIDYVLSARARRELAGGSGWSDGFTIFGFSGSVPISTRLTGEIAGESDLVYALFVSALPFDVDALFAAVGSDSFDDSDPQLPNAQRLFFTGFVSGCGTSRASRGCGRLLIENYEGPVDLPMVGRIEFVEGQPVHVLSILIAEVDDQGGRLNFINSADFGISIPHTATYRTLSGSEYTAAIPEPATALILLGGLGLLGARKRLQHL